MSGTWVIPFSIWFVTVVSPRSVDYTICIYAFFWATQKQTYHLGMVYYWVCHIHGIEFGMVDSFYSGLTVCYVKISLSIAILYIYNIYMYIYRWSIQFDIAIHA